LVSGIFKQGGKIVEFNENMSEDYAQFVIVDKEEDIDKMRKKLSGLIKYKMILSYEFVSASLNSLKRKPINEYILFDNTDTMNSEITSSEKARRLLEQEKLDEHLIRPKLEPHPMSKEETTEWKEKKEKRQHENEEKLKKVELAREIEDKKT
jgi:hypothetical protein